MKNKDFNRLKRERRVYLDTQRLLKQWNKELVRLGLSVESGRNVKLIYAGDTNDLAIIEQYDHPKR